SGPDAGPARGGPDSGRYAGVVSRLAAATGRTRAGMDLAVRAWREGGAAGLAVLEGGFTPDAALLARAADALESAWGEDGPRPRLRAAGAGRWTVVGTGAQLRLGPDGRWWAFVREGTAWAPGGPPSPDPATALAALTADAP
ncbi:SWF or SNF family helicase, partial [Streptomyces sp. NPDC005805]